MQISEYEGLRNKCRYWYVAKSVHRMCDVSNVTQIQFINTDEGWETRADLSINVVDLANNACFFVEHQVSADVLSECLRPERLMDQ